MKNTIYPQLVFLLALVAFFGSCKKTKDTTTATQPADSTTIAADAKDTALIDSKDFYLWYTQIPSSFNALSYTDPNSVMVALRTYSIEPGFTAPVDKWSFGVLKTDWNQLSGGIGNADNVNITGDFGLSVFFMADGDLRV
jgi:carboxyl-terminal processing protease